MHYFIYPSKDATIYSGSVSLGSSNKMQSNTGMDAILEIDKRIQPDYLEDNWSRVLLQFDTTEFENLVSTGVFSNFSTDVRYYLNLFDAGTEEIPLSNTLYAYPLSSSWEMGIGTLNDYPSTNDGVTWTWRDVSGSNHWDNPGGDYLTTFDNMNVIASQSFEYSTDDVKMDVSNIVFEWVEPSYIAGGYVSEQYFSTALTNNGFLIKRSDAEESDSKNYGIMKWFSMDTNTVYSPKLEVAWDDSVWSTGSLTALNTSDDIVLYMKGLQEDYNEKGKVRFRVCGRERYPERTFSNTSEYATVKYLPSGSTYYSIRDAYTDEVIVPFDTFSKVSCDSSGNYFDLWMNSFQVERYYKIVYKVVNSDGLEKFFDDDFSFKVVR